MKMIEKVNWICPQRCCSQHSVKISGCYNNCILAIVATRQFQA